MVGVALICPHGDVGSGFVNLLSDAGLVRLSLRKTRIRLLLLFAVFARSLMDCLELSGITMSFLSVKV